MSVLHTVNKSPFSHTLLSDCLAVCRAAHGVILIEDGVYAALPHSPCAQALSAKMAAGVAVYALTEDLSARGLGETVLDGIQTVNTAGFVALSCRYRVVQSWY